MTPRSCLLIGAPVDSGKRRPGCLMGPDAYRTAGLGAALAGLGHGIRDLGNLSPTVPDASDTTDGPFGLAETVGWTKSLAEAARDVPMTDMAIFLGGDHALSLGSVAGMADRAAAAGRPLFILWLDAHSDIHTPETSDSGNLHGTPVGYVLGRSGFDAFPPVANPVPGDRIAMIGLRSVDAAERTALADHGIAATDMRDIDESGIRAPLDAFLDRVRSGNGHLHVSLDVDFLDPDVAPAVGTTVPGGATLREAHLTMEILCDSGLVTSLDLVELNPFLDDRGQTARVMVDLTASLMGRRIFDRPTRGA